MPLCPRHDGELKTALELRGLYTIGGPLSTHDPLRFARTAIETHASHFAGKAAVAMLTRGWCPICFVNEALRRDHKTFTVDDWVNVAADEALDADIAHRDGEVAVNANAYHG